MKWFQVDADTPNDPKVRAIVRELGAAGMGGLFFLWCHIADHGVRKPGWSIDSRGRPIPEAELIAASGLNAAEFARLSAICTSTGHWLKKPWETRHVIAIPAMSKRADTYTKRRVRTRVEAGSTDVQREFANKQDIPSTTLQIPPTPLSQKGGRRFLRADMKAAERFLQLNFGRCPHETPCSGSIECSTALAIGYADRRRAAAS